MQDIKRNSIFKKTEKKIHKALFSLLRKQSLISIRCTDVIEKARISDSTFYNHYKNIFDLVSQIEKGIVQEVCLELRKIKAEEKDMKTSYRRLLLFLQQDLETTMLHADLMGILMSPLLQIEAKKIIFQYWDNFGGVINDRLFDILIAEIVAEIHWWKNEHFNDNQVDKHAERLVFFTRKIPEIFYQIVRD